MQQASESDRTVNKEKTVRSNFLHRQLLVAGLVFAGDVVTLLLCFFMGGILGYAVNVYVLSNPYPILFDSKVILERAYSFGILGIFALVWLVSKRRYTHVFGFWPNLGFTSKAVLAAFIVDSVIQYTTKQSFSRIWLVGSWSVALVLFPMIWFGVKHLLVAYKIWAREVIILGSKQYAKNVRDALNFENRGDHEVIDVSEVLLGKWEPDNPELQMVLRQARERRAFVVIAINPRELSSAIDFCRQLESIGMDFALAPDLGVEVRRGLFQRMEFVDGLALIMGVNRLARPTSVMIKRIMDVILSAIALILLGPLMAILGLVVRMDGGSALYPHTRIGLGGKPFECLKFRSMVPNADKMLQEILETNPSARTEWSRDFKLKNDPRITTIGKFFRRTSLDELPQFFNVIRGEMSLVGPRPVVAEELEDYYGEERELYTSIQPGITGLWQISGRNSLTYEKRIDLDTRYVRTWSVLLDLYIMLRTIPTVIRAYGAY